MIYDLHSHSTASDGALSPDALVERAAARGVNVLALTDHDSVAGYARAQSAAQRLGVRLIAGIELSVTWRNQAFHVLGLNIDPAAPALQAGIQQLSVIRQARADSIGQRLTKLGYGAAYQAALQLIGDAWPTRGHFARALVQQGFAADEKAAFERWLAHGKPAYVSTQWAALEDAVAWIRQAGGVAVLAHPQRYKLTNTKLRMVLTAFIEAGGEGMEVVCGNSAPDHIRDCAELARRLNLLASTGSDFHTPEHYWLELGRLKPLPADLTPVWTRWPDEPPLF